VLLIPDRTKIIERARPLLEPDESVAHVVRAMEGPNRFAGMIIALVFGIGVSLLLKLAVVGLPLTIIIYTRMYNRRVVLATDEGLVVLAGGRGLRWMSYLPTGVLERLPLETSIGPLQGMWMQTRLNGRRLFVVPRSVADVKAADADLDD
jgi:hypothetical protein